jgi:hypothetical protein
MITLEFLNGYWTVCVDSRPLVSFASYRKAFLAVPEAVTVMQ